jgi:hypothetical protein
MIGQMAALGLGEQIWRRYLVIPDSSTQASELQGPMRNATPGTLLQERLTEIAAALGPFSGAPLPRN